MGKRSRTKGAAGEREVAAILRPVFPDARRRCSGEESQGVAQGRDLNGTPGFALQSCHAHAPPIYRKLSEAEGAAKADELPVAVTKRTGGRWIATMRLDDWLILVRLSFEASRARILAGDSCSTEAPALETPALEDSPGPVVP